MHQGTGNRWKCTFVAMTTAYWVENYVVDILFQQ